MCCNAYQRKRGMVVFSIGGSCPRIQTDSDALPRRAANCTCFPSRELGRAANQAPLATRLLRTGNAPPLPPRTEISTWQIPHLPPVLPLRRQGWPCARTACATASRTANRTSATSSWSRCATRRAGNATSSTTAGCRRTNRASVPTRRIGRADQARDHRSGSPCDGCRMPCAVAHLRLRVHSGAR